jgi:hypothetical protein
MASEARERWFAHMMSAGLEEKIFEPADVLAQATPEVLANHLPPELMSKMLQASLAAGSMTPDRVLETVTPELLAKHVPHEVLWECIESAARQGGLAVPPESSPSPTPPEEK